ncbi:hypothetical protein BDV97DRAFT_304492 [Delphinella strobiligena]|nr:hypothetical protein BDV97DRAFT_304492 [Delphinella strobiligena]
MGSSAHDLNVPNQSLRRQNAGSDNVSNLEEIHQNVRVEDVSDVSQDDHVRSWLDATSHHSWPVNNNTIEAEERTLDPLSSRSPSVSPGQSEILQGGEEPPPYTIYDPAKASGVLEFELDENNPVNAKLFTPFYLQVWVFVAFALTFATMPIAIEIMWQFSNRNHGLGTSTSSKHYLWTYGPTLVLSILAAFWGQVDYRVRQLMPWKAMTKGPLPADKALLTDHVSTWGVSVFIAGFKARHFAISLVTAGSFLIKLAIIFSTALFSLESQRFFDDGAVMQLEDTFTSFGSGNTSYIQPVISAIGVSQYGLSYPPGTSETTAVQSFHATQTITDPSSMIFANVNAFSAGLICEDAIVSTVSGAQCDESADCDTVIYNLTVSSNTCTTNSSQVSASVNGSTSQYYGSVSGSGCLGEEDFSSNYRFTIISGHQPISYSDGAGNATQSTALICKPAYQVCRAPTALFLNGTILFSQASNMSCSSITGVGGWDVGTAVMDTIDYASGSSILDFPTSSVGYDGATVNIDAFFKTMNATALPNNLTQFQNITYLELTARHLFSEIAAQVAKSRLMEPVGMQIPGTIVEFTQRVYVQEVSLRLLETIFALMIAISMLTLLLRPSSSTPSDTSTIAGMATVLARSPRTAAAFQGLGSSRGIDLKQHLAEKTCHSVITNESNRPHFRLMTTSSGDYTGPMTDKITWWRPSSLSIYVRSALIIIPVALIAVLESVYQYSEKHHGLANVDESSSYHYVWTYIPALLMVVLMTGYEVVDFNTRVLQPYDNLRKAPTPAGKSIGINYLSHISPRCIWLAFRRRHWAVLVTAITMLLAPLLTVVVSGLYAPAIVTDYYEASITLNDTISNAAAWTATGSNPPDDARDVSTLITEANMSFPSWTYDGFVIPVLNSATFLREQFESNSTANTTTIMVTMPGYYASLNYYNITKVCDSSDSSSFHPVDFQLYTRGLSNYGVAYIPSGDYLDIPQDCPQLTLVYGQATVDTDNDTIALDMAAATCRPAVYRVTLNVTFAMPAFLIEGVKADYSTKQVISSGGIGNATLALNSWLPPTTWGVDSFFGGLVPGRNGTAWDDLIGIANFDNLSDAADNLYSIIYSQWLNLYGRSDDSVDSGALYVLVMDPTRQRLQQSVVSTRILEAFLALLAIFTFATFFLIDTKKLLPHNPCSIGAMAAYLAESDMLRTIPEGAEWHERKELTKKRVFNEYLFSLGWFQGLGGTRRFGIDIATAERGDTG